MGFRIPKLPKTPKPTPKTLKPQTAYKPQGVRLRVCDFHGRGLGSGLLSLILTPNPNLKSKNNHLKIRHPHSLRPLASNPAFGNLHGGKGRLELDRQWVWHMKSDDHEPPTCSVGAAHARQHCGPEQTVMLQLRVFVWLVAVSH